MYVLRRINLARMGTAGYVFHESSPNLKLRTVELPYHLGEYGNIDDRHRAILNGAYNIQFERVLSRHWMDTYLVNPKRPYMVRLDRYNRIGVARDSRIFLHVGRDSFESEGCILVPDVRSNDDILNFFEMHSDRDFFIEQIL